MNYLGHDMVNSVVINNLTDQDFEWTILGQEWGKASVLPAAVGGSNVIPKMHHNTDSWGDKTTVKVAYEARFQFINSNDLGSIGYVLGLQPKGGGTQAKLVASVPWAGDNTIWVGQSNDSPDAIYSQHSNPDGRTQRQRDAPRFPLQGDDGHQQALRQDRQRLLLRHRRRHRAGLTEKENPWDTART